MRTRGVIGKRIVAIEQEWTRADKSDSRPPYTSVNAIVLEDGTRLYPFTNETFAGYSTDFTVVKAHAERGAAK